MIYKSKGLDPSDFHHVDQVFIAGQELKNNAVIQLVCLSMG
jgi:hypothetical protein